MCVLAFTTLLKLLLALLISWRELLAFVASIVTL